MILVDSNIFMYAAGRDHPHKEPSERFLMRVAQGEVDAVVDAEVLQEILHRYRSLGLWEEARHIFDFARRIVPVALPITAEVMETARDLLDSHGRLTARGAVHAAVALQSGAAAICTYDRDFDDVRELRRVEP
jgi:predicted nucleic acid-binding protein